MKKIYVHRYPDGSVSYSSSTEIRIGSQPQNIFSVVVSDEEAEAYFNSPNDYIVDEGRGVLIRKT